MPFKSFKEVLSLVRHTFNFRSSKAGVVGVVGVFEILSTDHTEKEYHKNSHHARGL